jgi:hypothetical protein
MRLALFVLAGWLAVPAAAADLSKIDRTIPKEPIYSGSPRYCLLVFGPQAKDRVWLVQDGDTLYVDRNGNGDLTEPGEKVAAEKNSDHEEHGYSFEAGDLTVGGKVHKGLSVTVRPLKLYEDTSTRVASIQVLREALKANPKTQIAIIGLDVESDRFKGAGIGGRIMQTAGFYNLDGVLSFATTPGDAPVIHFDGPLKADFYGVPPTLWLERDNDVVLVVGSPGLGGGTFAMLDYDETIPQDAHPTVEVQWPGDPPVKELFELKKRC